MNLVAPLSCDPPFDTTKSKVFSTYQHESQPSDSAPLNLGEKVIACR